MTAVSPAERAGRSPERSPTSPRTWPPSWPGRARPPWPGSPAAISRETVLVPMRDGTRLATDVYRPPVGRAPAIALRTPYGRATLDATFLSLAWRATR